MKQFIKKFIGETVLLIGSGITSYSLFSLLQGVLYYYPDANFVTNKIFISIGIILIILGVLLIKNKK